MVHQADLLAMGTNKLHKPSQRAEKQGRVGFIDMSQAFKIIDKKPSTAMTIKRSTIAFDTLE